jgi:predicted O-methyltransferase YrrM
MKRFRILSKYILHFFTARNTFGFGVHSPFLFQFTRFVLREKHSFYIFNTIEKLRILMLKDNRILDINDFGTGNNRSKPVSFIADQSLKSAKYGQLLFRMVHYFKPHNVLELGTSLGITTSYLASSSTEIHCVSMEGCPQIAQVAKENIDKLDLKNIELVVGNIDNTLIEVLNKINKLDFVFFDANHQSKAILNYFELCLTKVHNYTIMVIDDVYWSDDMEMAWKKIKDHPQVTSTIDLFQIGIVFFNTDLHKKHYKMRY